MMNSKPATSNTGPDLKGLSMAETEAWAAELGIPPYRARQIRRWIFSKLVQTFQEMTDLPKDLRAILDHKVRLQNIEIAETLTSQDGTKKYIFRLKDGYLIESVLIPERDHLTLCISSQVGCAMGCRFCLTGSQGLYRNLEPGEIVDQVIQVKSDISSDSPLTNIVLMGMGEPLANYESVVRALNNIMAPDGMNFSHRKVTLSTCGLVPQIRRLGGEIDVNLAISLNAADDETRSYLMPINRKFPLSSLIHACRQYPLKNRRMITFEYVLVKEINDSEADARRLVALLRGIRAKVNLIPFNAHEHSGLEPSPMEAVLRFQDVLLKNHLTAIIRKSKGPDIMAACGQLGGSISLPKKANVVL